VQLEEAKLPKPASKEKLTVPLGTVEPVKVLLTVAVQVVGAPVTTGLSHESVVVVRTRDDGTNFQESPRNPPSWYPPKRRT